MKEFQIRVPNPKPIPGPSPLIRIHPDCLEDGETGEFFCPANNECYALKADDELLDDLPSDYRLAKHPNGKVDREWMYELFDFK
jgi:hypothetical protein